MLDGFANLPRGPGRGHDLPADRGDPRPPLAPLRQGRLDPRRAAGLHLAARADAARSDLEQMLLLDHGRRQHRLGSSSSPIIQAMRRSCRTTRPRRAAAASRPRPGFNTSGVLLHRRQRRLLPADARHDARAGDGRRPTSRPGSRRTGRGSSSSPDGRLNIPAAMPRTWRGTTPGARTCRARRWSSRSPTSRST